MRHAAWFRTCAQSCVRYVHTPARLLTFVLSALPLPLSVAPLTHPWLYALRAVATIPPVLSLLITHTGHTRHVCDLRLRGRGRRLRARALLLPRYTSRAGTNVLGVLLSRSRTSTLLGQRSAFQARVFSLAFVIGGALLDQMRGALRRSPVHTTFTGTLAVAAQPLGAFRRGLVFKPTTIVRGFAFLLR